MGASPHFPTNQSRSRRYFSMTSPPDETLVRQSLDGNARAFEALVERYQHVLYNLAFRLLGSREDARDAVQTAFLKAYQNLDRFDPRFRFYSWLYRIALNESLRSAGKARLRNVEALSDSMVSTEKGPGDRLDDRNRGLLLQAALERLPSEQRQVVVLQYFSELSQRDIGELLDIPEKTVKSRMYEARKAMAAYLATRGVHEA
jgi:RNA polymerase sigma-70 factor (ECF subfamily)